MIGIITLNDYSNFGNRLQNYAVFKILSKYDKTVNIKRFYGSEYPDGLLNQDVKFDKEILKRFIDKLNFYQCSTTKSDNKVSFSLNETKRRDNFLKFNEYIEQGETLTYNTNFDDLNNKYDYFVTGSDQVFNPYLPGNTMFFNMLGFASKEKRIALTPSVAIDDLSNDEEKEFKKYLSDFEYLSCREEDGANLITKIVGKKCEAILDPVFMLDAKKWEEIEKKPEGHDENKKYILLYFLGDLTEKYQKLIDDLKDKYDLEVINLLDENSDYYACGPSEFIYMIHHCEIMLTDSFHGSAFSYIFNKPLRIFRRLGHLKSMNSRLTNIINKLHLGEDIYITEDSEIIEIKDPKYNFEYLRLEQDKFNKYLEKALRRG